MSGRSEGCKFIFVTGGVVSSLGKGVATASIGFILRAMGYKIFIKKLDPYLNIDPGTMNPKEHGEVFVTEDGGETDLDLGHYERFTGVKTSKDSNMTAGRIYQTLLEKERNGDYLGQTVQVIPHVTNLIKNFIKRHEQENDFIICEIGGTVGDIEALPFFEAIRQIRGEIGVENTMFVHLTLIPFLQSTSEIKTKPTQHSVKELMSIGIIPDALICRTDIELLSADKQKIASFCNVNYDCVIEGLNLDNIYKAPLSYINQGFDRVIMRKFNISSYQKADVLKLQDTLAKWEQIKTQTPKKLAIAGKYTSLKDSYKSLSEAIYHASVHCGINLDISFLDTRAFDNQTTQQIADELAKYDGVIVPGGFGTEGLEGKINVIKTLRETNKPFLGICLGMQMAVIEFARNVLGIKNANTQEVMGDSQNYIKIVGIMNAWMDGEQIINSQKQIGGSMRLGNYTANIVSNTLCHKIYAASTLTERHRHRYEVDISFKTQLEKAGMIISAFSPNGKLPEVVEIPTHKFFLAVQYHPEFNSSVLTPNPLFVSFIESL